ncbi:MAG: GtrA family protein [Bacteroidetes bacterium]|nr:GtrA family protein [Bacteroidota bacterium]
MKSPLHLFRKVINQIIDFTYPPFKKIIPLETFRYAVTGGANTAFDIVLYIIFYRFILEEQIVDLGFIAISPHIAAFIFVFPITFPSGFLLAKYITFTSSLIIGRIQLFRYGITVAGAIILNYLLLKVFIENLGLYAAFSKILTTIIVVIYSYFVQRLYSFKTGMINLNNKSQT